MSLFSKQRAMVSSLATLLLLGTSLNLMAQSNLAQKSAQDIRRAQSTLTQMQRLIDGIEARKRRSVATAEAQRNRRRMIQRNRQNLRPLPKRTPNLPKKTNSF